MKKVAHHLARRIERLSTPWERLLQYIFQCLQNAFRAHIMEGGGSPGHLCYECLWSTYRLYCSSIDILRDHPPCMRPKKTSTLISALTNVDVDPHLSRHPSCPLASPKYMIVTLYSETILSAPSAGSRPVTLTYPTTSRRIAWISTGLGMQAWVGRIAPQGELSIPLEYVMEWPTGKEIEVRE